MDRTVMMISCVLLAMFIGACAEGGDGSSGQGAQVETIAPAGTRTVGQMQEYEKSHPPSGEKRIMPMPGTAPEQNIDALPRSEPESGDMR